MDRSSGIALRSCRWWPHDRLGTASHSNEQLSIYFSSELSSVQRSPVRKWMQRNEDSDDSNNFVTLTIILFRSKLMPVKLTIWWAVKGSKNKIDFKSLISPLKSNNPNTIQWNTYNLYGRVGIGFVPLSCVILSHAIFTARTRKKWIVFSFIQRVNHSHIFVQRFYFNGFFFFQITINRNYRSMLCLLCVKHWKTAFDIWTVTRTNWSEVVGGVTNSTHTSTIKAAETLCVEWMNHFCSVYEISDLKCVTNWNQIRSISW